MKQILTERGLQRKQVLNGCVFFLEYLISHNCLGCDPLLNDNYGAQVVMSKQSDF